MSRVLKNGAMLSFTSLESGLPKNIFLRDLAVLNEFFSGGKRFSPVC